MRANQEELGAALSIMADAEISAACERAFALLPNLPAPMAQQAEYAIARARRLLAGEREGSDTLVIPGWDCLALEHEASDALVKDRADGVRLAVVAWSATAIREAVMAARTQRRARWQDDLEYADRLAASADLWAGMARKPQPNLHLLRIGPWAVAR